MAEQALTGLWVGECGEMVPAAYAAKLMASDHLQARGFFVEVEHPAAGVLTYLGAPYEFSETSCQVRSPAPLLGQHTQEVLRGLLGYSEAEVAAVQEGGVLV